MSYWILAYFKNYVRLGNPFFPFFFCTVFDSPVGWTKDSAAGYFQMLTEYESQSHLFLDLVLAPWKIARYRTHYGGRIAGVILVAFFFMGRFFPSSWESKQNMGSFYPCMQFSIFRFGA